MINTGDDIRARFGTRTMGACVHVHDEIDSTNLAALRLARAGAVEGTLVLARHQTAGRGRLGRGWTDLPGRSLLLTALVAPPTEMQWLVTCAAALALAEGVDEWLDLPALIKWPNDVMVHDRKVAGVLAEGPAAGLMAVGMGVNVAGRAAELPEELRESAGYLSEEAGRELDPEELLGPLLPRLDANCLALKEGRADELLDRVRRLDYLVGRRVTVRGARRELTGEAAGWADSGALLIRDDAGKVYQFEAGDVTVR